MIAYKKIIVFYFSGTGNAQNVSHWIVEKAGQKNIETEIINISDRPVALPEINKDTLIGFCFPTHGFNLAPAMLHFIYRFSNGTNDFFLVNTRAGLKLWKLYYISLP